MQDIRRLIVAQYLVKSLLIGINVKVQGYINFDINNDHEQ